MEEGVKMDNRKIETIQIRLTTQEKDFIKLQSSKKKMCVSDYIRYCIMKQVADTTEKKLK